MRDWLSHRAATTPDATALINTDTDRRRSFADLDQLIDRTAGYLSALGVSGGDHVGVLLADRQAAIQLLWATMRLGAVYVPLRPGWEPETIAGLARDTDVQVLICDSATERTARAADVARTVTVDDPETASIEQLSSYDSVSVAPNTWTRSEPASIMFTAGTTGQPKPVVLEMGNHLANATDAAFHFGTLPSDRWLSCHPLHHVNGLGTAMRAMLFGSALVIQTEASPGGLADILDTHRVTCLTASPATVSEMLDARGMLSDSIRAVILTGAPTPLSLLERCRGYSIPAHPAYSITEAAGLVAAGAPNVGTHESRSVGYPLFRTEVNVIDADGRPVGRGQTGELVVSGPAVTPGYYDPEVGGPADRDGHGVTTGDIGFRDENGLVHVISRRIDRILVDGETVRAADIRDVLREHDGVANVAVVGIPDGDGGERLGALVVRAASDPTLDAETLEQHCEQRLAEFVVPSQFVFAPSLPRTPSGDVDRQAVRQQLLDQAE